MRRLAVLLLLLTSCATTQHRTFLDKPSPDHIRVLAWNVGRNSIIPGGDAREWAGRPEGSARVLKAMQPDVVCLNEMQIGQERAADRFNEILPLPDGAKWQTHGIFDIVILSRWPLSSLSAKLLEEPGKRRAHATALVDVPEDRGRDLYVVCAHNQSRDGADNIAFRQYQSDTIMSWMRDAVTPGGEITLPPGTPFVILGDFNVIVTDPGNHLKTLVTGDIFDNDVFGPDFKPDWDGTDLTDAHPPQNGEGDVRWTWRHDVEGFIPNALDRIVYSDSAFCVDNAFVVNTRTMRPRDLARHGLRPDDVMRDPATDNYDHLPVVIDGRSCR